MDQKILEKTMRIAEQFFGTEKDPDQMPINLESFYKIQKLHPKTIMVKLDGSGEPISWIVVLPTSKELMHKFLDSAVTERELLDMSQQQERYEALYLCAAFTIPEHRRKGLTTELFKEAMNSIPLTDDFQLFAWPFSEEGKQVIEKLRSVLGKEILIKK